MLVSSPSPIQNLELITGIIIRIVVAKEKRAKGPGLARLLADDLPLQVDGKRDQRNAEETILQIIGKRVTSDTTVQRVHRAEIIVLEVENGEIALLMKRIVNEKLLESRIMDSTGSLRIIGSVIISKGVDTLAARTLVDKEASEGTWEALDRLSSTSESLFTTSRFAHLH